MNINKCAICNVIPKLQTDSASCEYYRFICPNCGRHTEFVYSSKSTFANPHCDDFAYQRLVEKWNDMNHLC